MSLRALIIDDEELARRRVLDFLSQNDHITCIGECESAASAIESILRERPDVVFLDIQMPELDGFAILDAVREEYLPAIVFTTAHDEHAIRAFEIRAVDYLLKPFSKLRFDDAVARLKKADSPSIHDDVRSLLQEVRKEKRYPEKMPFKTNGKIVILSTDKIEWIEAERDYIRLHVQKESYLIRGTMGNMEVKLPSEKFVRIHRSAIVNADYIAELRPVLGGEYAIKLRTGTELTLSRTYREKLSDLIPQLLMAMD